jgi:carbonic anhydrase
MCVGCAAAGRRGFLSFAAAGVAGLLARPAGAATALTAEAALAKLQDGNKRYVAGPQLCADNMLKQRADVARGQAPFATILGCSDSRVTPELIFGGVALGELFVARNAGNMADTATMGTIEYGAEHLGTPLVVVLGHADCGAVAAACEVVMKHASLPGSMGPMVEAIVPAARAMRGKPGDFIDNTVRESARRTARRIATDSPVIRHLAHEGKVRVVYARYDLDSGVVEFLG